MESMKQENKELYDLMINFINRNREQAIENFANAVQNVKDTTTFFQLATKYLGDHVARMVTKHLSANSHGYTATDIKNIVSGIVSGIRPSAFQSKQEAESVMNIKV